MASIDSIPINIDILTEVPKREIKREKLTTILTSLFKNSPTRAITINDSLLLGLRIRNL
jgi:hypothetical protein